MKTALLALLLSFLAIPAAQARDRKHGDDADAAALADLPRETDFTAWSVPKKQWRLALGSLNYGLIRNGDIGTQTLAWPFGLPNINGKVTAIQGKKITGSLEGAYYYVDGARLNIDNAAAIMVPVGTTFSWSINPKNSLHLGETWYLFRMEGGLSASQMGSMIELATGANLSDDLLAAADASGLSTYAGANLTLAQSRFAYHHRFNEKSALVLEANRFLSYSGLIASGISQNTGETEVDVGASVRIEATIPKKVPTITSLAYQRDWKRLHARVGIPLVGAKANQLTKFYAFSQSVEVFWLLGGEKHPASTRDE